jgi:hypothetical protein
MNITKDTATNKTELLKYYRDRSSEILSEINAQYGIKDYKKKAKKLNPLLIKSKNTLIEIVQQKGKKDNWTNREILECILMISYCNYVVILEARHSVWPYENMDFSRRIGELWEPFCKLAFEYPINDIELFVPPLFSDVKKLLADEIEDYINLAIP